MKNLAGLMKQASQMQSKMEEMQARLQTMEIDGESGAGIVRGELQRREVRGRRPVRPVTTHHPGPPGN